MLGSATSDRSLLSVLGLTGYVVAGIGVFCLLPALVAITLDGGGLWEAFLLSSLLITSVGLLVATSVPASARIANREALLIMPATLVASSFAAALPLYLATDLNLVDAFFEAVSALTTTGATIITNLDVQPRSVLFWRSLLQWLGGINVVVIGMILLPRLGLSGMHIFRLELYEGMEKAVVRLLDLSRWVIGVYVLLTVFCFIAFAANGMTSFDALNHALTTVATGGFSTHNDSFAAFDSAAIEACAVAFMLAGSLPLIRFIQVLRGDMGRGFAKDDQVRFFLLVWALMVVLLTVLVSVENDLTLRAGFRLAVFNVTSILTGTGFATSDFASWGAFSIPLFLLLMVMGGCAGSTSCGLKQFRVYMLFLRLREHLLSMVQPNRVMVTRFNGQTVDAATLESVTTYFFIFVLTIGVTMGALSMAGLDFVTAFSGAVSAVANVGPGLGPVIGPVSTYGLLPDSAKWILCVGMLLGRLEILVFLIILMPRFWRHS